MDSPITKIISSRKSMTVQKLYDQWKSGGIKARPDFQRGFIWDKKKASRIIESMMLGVPIPPIYLAENEDDKLIVIDGQQRLLSAFSYIDNLFPPHNGMYPSHEFPLSNLKILSDLNRISFFELSSQNQDLVRNYEMSLVIIGKDSDYDARFEIFERLNTGSVKLNEQEIRNCIFRGSYNKFLKKLAADNEFQNILSYPQYAKRMNDVELVLRFCAFNRNDYHKFKQPAKQFLNNEMREHLNISQEEQDIIEKMFRKSVSLTKSVFGSKAFRRFTFDKSGSPHGHFEQKIFNKGLFDIIMYGFSLYEKQQVMPNADDIRQKLIELMSNDEEFIDAIAGAGTESKEKIQIKFDKWISALKEIINTPPEKRLFPFSLKKQLFDLNPTCAMPGCEQQILTIDDAELDHIEQYHNGGKTVPANARLVHRYCNKARGRFN